MRVIDDECRRAVHVERDIAHDADNLERRPAAGRNALPDDGVERHAWKRGASKIGAHHYARWRVAVVARVECAARKHRNSSAAKTSPLTVRCWMLNPSLVATACRLVDR